MDDAKCLVINVRPGWKKGTKVSFVNEGDEAPNTIPADLVFVIQEKENSDPGYVREGNNLIYTYRLSLSDALTDHNALQIPTLDQRVISLACPEVVSPFYEKVILGKFKKQVFGDTFLRILFHNRVSYPILKLVFRFRRGHADHEKGGREGRPDRSLPHSVPQVPQRGQAEPDQGAPGQRRTSDLTISTHTCT